MEVCSCKTVKIEKQIDKQISLFVMTFHNVWKNSEKKFGKLESEQKVSA